MTQITPTTQYEKDLRMASGIVKVLEAYEKDYLKNDAVFVVKKGAVTNSYKYDRISLEGHDIININLGGTYVLDLFSDRMYQIGSGRAIAKKISFDEHYDDYFKIFTEEEHFQKSTLYSTEICTALFVISYITTYLHRWCTSGITSIQISLKYLDLLIDHVRGLPQNEGL